MSPGGPWGGAPVPSDTCRPCVSVSGTGLSGGRPLRLQILRRCRRNSAGLLLAALGMWVVLFAGFVPSAEARERIFPGLVFDAETGIIIHDEHIDHLWRPASLTKMMTAYLVFEAVRDGRLLWSSKYRPTRFARFQPKVRHGMNMRRKYSVDFLLKTMMARSSNDAAAMLAQLIGAGPFDLPRYRDVCLNRYPRVIHSWTTRDGPDVVTDRDLLPDRQTLLSLGVRPNPFSRPEGKRRCCFCDFIVRMNKTAKQLGMKHTFFETANGLPAYAQLTTVRDFGILAHALFRDFPEYRELLGLPTITVNGGERKNFNRLLGTYEGADGIKTGFTCGSGYNLVASATRDGVTLVAVVMGAIKKGERYRKAEELLDWGFETVAWRRAVGGPTLYEPGPAPGTPTGPGDVTRKIRGC